MSNLLLDKQVNIKINKVLKGRLLKRRVTWFGGMLLLGENKHQLISRGSGSLEISTDTKRNIPIHVTGGKKR